MVTTSPYHTESSTAYRELEESRSALLIPEEVPSAQAQEERLAVIEELPEVWAPTRKEAFLSRIARRMVAFPASAFLYFDWLAEPPMTERERIDRKIAKARSELYAYTQLKL